MRRRAASRLDDKPHDALPGYAPYLFSDRRSGRIAVRFYRAWSASLPLRGEWRERRRTMHRCSTAQDLPRSAASLAVRLVALMAERFAAGPENVPVLPQRTGKQRPPPILDVISS